VRHRGTGSFTPKQVDPGGRKSIEAEEEITYLRITQEWAISLLPRLRYRIEGRRLLHARTPSRVRRCVRK